MAKWDAEERASQGLPIPADVSLLLRQLTAGAIEAGGVTDLLQLMARYANQHLTAAQVIAELVAMAKEVSADAGRGADFDPALPPGRAGLLRRRGRQRVGRDRDGHRHPRRHRP